MAQNRYLCMQISTPHTKEAAAEDAGSSTGAGAPSPGSMEAMYAAFQAWQAQFKDHIVDMGGPLGDGRIATAQGIKDGPFIETKELIGGYMILTADTLDEAVEVARACPGVVRPGSSIEVRVIRQP